MDLPRGVQYHSDSVTTLAFALDVGSPDRGFNGTARPAAGSADDRAGLPGPFAVAAAGCLAEAGLAGPDATIIVPDAALVGPLKRALFARSSVAGRAWLAPRIDTVDGLAARALPVPRVRSREARLLALAAALAEDGRAGWSGRLQRAAELLEPIDAIARTLVCDWLAAGAAQAPPAWDEEAVLTRLATLAEAARPGLAAVFGGEWRTVARLGRVVATADDPVAVAARQWQALREVWRAQAPRLVRVGWWPLAAHAAAEAGGDVLRALVAGLPAVALTDCVPDRTALAASSLFVRAWPEVGATDPAAAAGWADRMPIRHRSLAAGGGTPAAARVEAMLLHALDREDESMRAAAWVHRALADGAASVAIVVLDRWLARRTRALLERAAVLIDDREGWALSTTVAATWPIAWLDVCSADPVDDRLPVHGPAWIALASLLDSAFTDHPDGRRFAALLRRRTLGDRVEPAPALASLERALVGLVREQRAARTARDQAAILRRAMAALGADRTLPADEAGRQVLAMIERLGSPAETLRRRCDHEAFRALLGFFLERQRFHDSAIRSPVTMTGLAAAAGLRFDAVLILGANAGQLPAMRPPAPGLVDALLPGLGLAPAAVSAHDQLLALVCLLGSAARCAFTCRSDPGDGTLPSPLVVRLAAVAGLDLRTAGQRGALPRRRVAPRAGAADRHPMPRPAEPAVLPEVVTVSAIDRLVQCPFRFLVTDVWRLGEPRDSEEEPGRRELGIVVHAALERFHREIADPSDLSDDALAGRLEAHTEAVLAERPMLFGARLVELREWRAVLPDYVRAFRADHAAGWRFEAGEQRVEARIALSGGRELRIVGKFDRLDRHDRLDPLDPGAEPAPAPVRRVIDYKLRSVQHVGRLAADPDSAAQLLLYAWFTGSDEAAYLAIDRKSVVAKPLLPAPVETLPAWRARVVDALERIAGGAPLRALGERCDLCDARGICRQGHWRDEAIELSTGTIAADGTRGDGVAGREDGGARQGAGR